MRVIMKMDNWEFIDEYKIFSREDVFTENDGGKAEIQAHFPDPEGLLASAYHSLLRLHAGSFTLETAFAPTEKEEEYILFTSPGFCRITAGDTEGIRRGIYHLKEKLLSLSPDQFPVEEKRVSPFLKTRIARCFFGPIKRPPLNRDELLDDVDYYPEGYLDRLAAEGINVIWITFHFSDFAEEAPQREKRIAKLKKTIAKCRKYGVKIYLFCNEPAAWANSETAVGTPGPAYLGRRFFCAASEESLQYSYNALNRIFREIPELGGVINIVFGEGLTTCLSGTRENNPHIPPPCNKKCRLTPSEIMRKNLAAMEKGIHDAAPKAEFIAWFYAPWPGPLHPWLQEVLSAVPEGVIPQLNFESGIEMEQLGRKRTGGDYWLMTHGASENFRIFAGNAAKENKCIGAKIQVGSSHEVATVPYIPVPGVLYKKYRSMRNLHVSHVMQCWYFGCTPGLMNMAAGLLSFTDFEKTSEEEFLHTLACARWGKELTPEIAAIWQELSNAYSNYPLSNMIQYLGPAADGVRWPLYPEYQDKGLRPTWIINNDTPSGDNIVECLGKHSLSDAAELFRLLSEGWHKAAMKLSALRKKVEGNKECLREIGLVEALDIQFATAARIFAFYNLRRELYEKKSLITLAKMRSIVEEEREERKKLILLAEQDPRLGFHPEAEAYKYNKELIEKSLPQLEELLQKDFPRLENELSNGTFHSGKRESLYHVNQDGIRDCENFSWSMTRDNGHFLTLKIHCQGVNKRLDEIFVGLDARDVGFIVSHAAYDGKIYVPLPGSCEITRQEDSYSILYRIPEAELPGGKFENIRLNIVRIMGSYSNFVQWPPFAKTLSGRINIVFYDPANMGNID